MKQEYDVRINWDVKINPRTPYQNTVDELRVRQAEVYLASSIAMLISALEEKLTREFNPEEYRDYGIKSIEIK